MYRHPRVEIKKDIDKYKTRQGVYEFKCKNCKKITEVFPEIEEKPKLEECPECGEKELKIVNIYDIQTFKIITKAGKYLEEKPEEFDEIQKKTHNYTERQRPGEISRIISL
jgi:putative FmdB family regulatory protein